VIGAYVVPLGIIAIDGASICRSTAATRRRRSSAAWSRSARDHDHRPPSTGALVTLALIAAFALVTGITELVVASGGKRLVVHEQKRSFGTLKRSEPQPAQ